jgi:hypothetical protein
VVEHFLREIVGIQESTRRAGQAAMRPAPQSRQIPCAEFFQRGAVSAFGVQQQLE